MPTINIMFRGLLVLNKTQVDGKASMEVGILAVPEPEHEHEHKADPENKHTPRIMTFRNGVREETMVLDLARKPNVWKLVVDDPVSQGITLRQHGEGPLNRMTSDTPDDDFRWIINLENNEFPYGNIDKKFGLNRADLKRVLQITSGEFYTRLKSPLLRRIEKTTTAFVEFGSLAGVGGLEIQVNSGGARLVGQNPNDVIFMFKSDPNVMYEIANSPADTIATARDHFPHYYDIFATPPDQQFTFARKPSGPVGAPAPNPALCGKIYLGEFDGSLESMTDSGGNTPAPGPHDHEHNESGTANEEAATA
jgi:hypothetical protein